MLVPKYPLRQGQPNALDVQVAEEEAENVSRSPEDDDVDDESMDVADGSLPTLGKRRSTDTALSGQNASKRSRPGSLAEVRAYLQTCSVPIHPVVCVVAVMGIQLLLSNKMTNDGCSCSGSTA